MKEIITRMIREYVSEYEKRPDISTAWGVPLVGFADASISNWSQRHFAKAAGLGTFGINNMLITKSGCCGRYSTIVTNLDVEPDQPLTEDDCIYKKSSRCGACISRCPSGALTDKGYDREKCYKVLKKNAELYTKFGGSSSDETGNPSNSSGSEVCGKCVSNVPCSFL